MGSASDRFVRPLGGLFQRLWLSLPPVCGSWFFAWRWLNLPWSPLPHSKVSFPGAPCQTPEPKPHRWLSWLVQIPSWNGPRILRLSPLCPALIVHGRLRRFWRRDYFSSTMENSSMKAQMIAILILLVGLTACAGPQPTQTPDIPATVTAQVEAHLDSVPKATPLPTHTPYPTGTPYLTPTQVQTATFYPTAIPPPRHGRRTRPTLWLRRCLPPPLIQHWQRSRLTRRIPRQHYSQRTHHIRPSSRGERQLRPQRWSNSLTQI